MAARTYSAFDCPQKVIDGRNPNPSSTTPTPPGNRTPTHRRVLGDPSYGMAAIGGSAPRHGVRKKVQKRASQG